MLDRKKISKIPVNMIFQMTLSWTWTKFYQSSLNDTWSKKILHVQQTYIYKKSRSLNAVEIWIVNTVWSPVRLSPTHNDMLTQNQLYTHDSMPPVQHTNLPTHLHPEDTNSHTTPVQQLPLPSSLDKTHVEGCTSFPANDICDVNISLSCFLTHTNRTATATFLLIGWFGIVVASFAAWTINEITLCPA